LPNASGIRRITLSEAQGRIDHLENELSAVRDLVNEGSEKSSRLVSMLDEVHQAFKNSHKAKKPFTKKQAAKMLKDRENEARNIRSFISNISERCSIALNGYSQ
jgi:alanyl-tRNA synthetase